MILEKEKFILYNEDGHRPFLSREQEGVVPVPFSREGGVHRTTPFG